LIAAKRGGEKRVAEGFCEQTGSHVHAMNADWASGRQFETKFTNL